jgi:hypothetical protein
MGEVRTRDDSGHNSSLRHFQRTFGSSVGSAEASDRDAVSAREQTGRDGANPRPGSRAAGAESIDALPAANLRDTAGGSSGEDTFGSNSAQDCQEVTAQEASSSAQLHQRSSDW